MMHGRSQIKVNYVNSDVKCSA